MSEPKYEYFLYWWGGCQPTVKKELGLAEFLWFDTKKERDVVLEQIKEYRELGFNCDTSEGYFTRKRTVACIVFEHQAKLYYIEYDFGYGYEFVAARYMFYDGNYCCDCNRSTFIRGTYPEFEELDCGNEIKLQEMIIDYRE